MLHIKGWDKIIYEFADIERFHFNFLFPAIYFYFCATKLYKTPYPQAVYFAVSVCISFIAFAFKHQHKNLAMVFDPYVNGYLVH